MSAITTESGSPRFTILPPSTIQDDGSPSDSLPNDAKRLLRFIQDERHLVAGELLVTIRTRLESAATVLAKEKAAVPEKRFFKRSAAAAASSKQQLELQTNVQETLVILEENKTIISLLEVRITTIIHYCGCRGVLWDGMESIVCVFAFRFLFCFGPLHSLTIIFSLSLSLLFMKYSNVVSFSKARNTI
jgi:hypothetical protein